MPFETFVWIGRKSLDRLKVKVTLEGKMIKGS